MTGKRTFMTTDSMEDRIRQFILTEFLPREKPENLHNDTPLRTSGVLDSVATLRLVTFVEAQFGIRVEAEEVASYHPDLVLAGVYTTRSTVQLLKSIGIKVVE